VTEIVEASDSDAAAIRPSFPAIGFVNDSGLAPAVSERFIIFLVGAVQFVNVLDFMMVMPLGPDFSDALGIATSHIGVIGGAYTAAAAVAGLLGSLFLDRFDRRRALGVAMFGLVLGTALGGMATGLTSMLFARVVAGCFGGPATSIALAIVADAVPPARRGKALGAVMGAFAVASVVGVPLGLELSRIAGWRSPFLAVAALGLLVSLTAIGFMPPMRNHLSRATASVAQPRPRLLDLTAYLSLGTIGTIMFGVFAVVPFLSPFLQHNLGYPRDKIGMLYMVGGIASFIAMRIVGYWVDRAGASRMVLLGTLFYAAALYACFIHPMAWLPTMFVFTLFMLSGSVRMVPMQTLASRVPKPEQRARFMSAQSVVQHVASAIGAMGASACIGSTANGALLGMESIARIALALGCVVPLGALLLERQLRGREASRWTEAAARIQS
jgi:predicted MFS family arabinose efflux permease